MRQKPAYRLAAAVLCCVLLSACASLSIPATVKQTAGNGTHLMQTVQAMATAVETAEASGRIPRNKAIQVMATLLKVTDAAAEAVKFLRLLLVAKTPVELNSMVDNVSRALESVTTGIFQAFIPIEDETLKTDIGLLAAEMSRTIAIVNRELIGRVYAK